MPNLLEFYDYVENQIPTLNPDDYGLSDGDEEEEDEEDEEDEEYLPFATSPRVSQGDPSSSNQVIVVPENDSQEEEGIKRRRTEEGTEASSSQGNDWNRTDIDGLFCPICMEAWTNNGDHHICCLPCGHIYGMSCIKRWLQQRRSAGKCPQCNRKCSLKDVRKLYASRVVAVDDDCQQRIRSLEGKCAALKIKDANWRQKEAGWKKREAKLHLEVQKLTMRNSYLEQLLVDVQSRQSGYAHNFGSKFPGKGSFSNFELQRAFPLDGARVFDMDTSNQILLIAQKPRTIGGMHFLTKMSLIHPSETKDITTPGIANGIRDLHISPSNSNLALCASLGKKLSVLSLESNNLVVNYDLQYPAWSCSWDLNSSHYIYAGLQNGSVLVFDVRQTAGPMKSLTGLTGNPVHTVQSLVQASSVPSGARSILSASAIGLCQWNVDSEEGPLMVPETDNQGVCISLAYSPSSDDIVVSYRPKVDTSMDVLHSQTSPPPSQVSGQGIQGCHVLFKRQGIDNFQKMGSSYANVSKLRFQKCVITDIENQGRLFASGDEVTCELVFHELPSFRVLQQFKLPAHARDIRYSPNSRILGCLSEKTIQLFNAKLTK